MYYACLISIEDDQHIGIQGANNDSCRASAQSRCLAVRPLYCPFSRYQSHSDRTQRALVLSACATDVIVQRQPPRRRWLRLGTLEARLSSTCGKVLRHPATRPPRAAGRRQQYRDRIAQRVRSECAQGQPMDWYGRQAPMGPLRRAWEAPRVPIMHGRRASQPRSCHSTKECNNPSRTWGSRASVPSPVGR